MQTRLTIFNEVSLVILFPILIIRGSSFSEDLNVPDDISLTDYLKQNYGDEANKIVDDIIELATDFAETMSASTDGQIREEKTKGLLGIARKLNGSVK